MANITDSELLRQFNMRMETLRQDGVFTTQKRSVTGDARYLIVSYGGTGADALFQIRRTLRKTLPADEFKQFIRFLAIDTDKNTKKQTELVEKDDGTKETVVRDALEADEFCWLDGSKARSALEPLDKNVAEWINPNLPSLINSDKNFLAGDGASATRQIGRLTLFPSLVCDDLRTKIHSHVKALVTGNKDPLYIFIVTGISGGTGSGIVIDASYLIRDVAAKVTHGLADRTRISGFVLLPPTGDSDAALNIKQKGNRNGYAAMKEINHFMTLAARKDCYRQVFGSTEVISDKNIFDSCYLMDGTLLTVLIENPREFVKSVLADCVVDMITSQPTAADGKAAPRAIDSLTSDVTAFTIAMLSTETDTHGPRDADYLYCVLGHGKVSIPVDEIKTYVAKKIFDKMYKSYQAGGFVDNKDVKDFVGKIRKAGGQWKAETDRQLNGYFTDPEYGPFFVINLLHDALSKVREEKGKMFANVELWSGIENYFLTLNKRYFSVFTEVLETLKAILDEQYDMVCQGTYSHNAKGSTVYSFRPISLEKGDEASESILTYLSDLVTASRVNKLSEDLLNTIITNRDIWGRLDAASSPNGPAFDAPAQIRIFWEREITKIVNATIEDLLIKLYSGDKNAKYDENDPQSQAHLKTAAQKIFDSMFGSVGNSLPTASLALDKGLNLTNFNGHNYMMVPQEAPHLIEALREVAKGSAVRVYSSTASDCISCYSQYTSIPCFKFVWTREAEGDYEAQIGIDGLHMAETSGTNNWRELPNLMPMSTWAQIPHFENPREEKLANRAKTLFTRAKELDLTVAVPAIGVDLLQYSMKRLKDDMLPDQNLFKEFDVRDVAAADAKTIQDREKIWNTIQDQAKAAAKKLYDSVDNWMGVDNIVDELESSLFIVKELRTVNAVLALPSMPDGWSEEIAARFLRKMPDLMAYMRGTIMVMDYLTKMVRAAQAEKQQIVDFTKYVVADLFYFDEKDRQWKYSDGSSEHVLFFQHPLNPVHKYAPYHFMFEEYKKNADAIKEALEEEYEDLTGAHDDHSTMLDKLLALNDMAQKLHDAIDKKLKLDKKNPDKMEMLGSTDFVKAATTKGFDANAIKATYQNMKDTLLATFSITIVKTVH